MTKQMKLTRLFRRGAPKAQEDHDELQEEIQQLEQQLKEKHDELFQLQRNSCRRKIPKLKKKSEPFVRPEKIILSNSVQTLKQNLELMSLLSGMEVQSYVADNHCSIVYHLQHKSEYKLKHGLKIDIAMNGGNKVSMSSLPLGFNLTAVLDGFTNVMLPECLVGVRKALVAYYDRLEQFNQLKTLLNIEAQLFKILDGSHIEITFAARSEHRPEDDQFGVTLILDYRVYDIRPKQYSFIEIDMPEEAVEALRGQCTVFKKKPLHKAFKEAFIDGNGAYVMVQEVDISQDQPRRTNKRSRPVNHRYNNDDTFHPDDCSDSDDEAVDE